MSIDLARERKNRGKSQAEMAALVGVTRRVWGAAERGAEPRGESARKIAQFFDVEVADIWPITSDVSAA